jgi:hypothetical protein
MNMVEEDLLSFEKMTLSIERQNRQQTDFIKRIGIYLGRELNYRVKAANKKRTETPMPAKEIILVGKEKHTFEDLFYNSNHAAICLQILNDLEPPIIQANNHYIGNNKGVIPLWIKILKEHKPYPLVKPFRNKEYAAILNEKIPGLNLTSDASEFKRPYKRVDNSDIGIDIKAKLSLLSQKGKLGK